MKIVSDVKWATVGNMAVAFFQALQLIVLIYFLDQKEMGLFAILFSVIGFAQIFIDAGLSNALIYYDIKSKKILRILYLLNIVIGFFIAIIVYFFSYALGRFYSDSLVDLVQIISIVFLINSFGAQKRALLQKELFFKELAIVDIISNFFGFSFLLIFLLADIGILALCYSMIIQYSTLNLCLIFSARKKYFEKNDGSFNIKELKDILNFAYYQMGEKFLSYIGAQSDVLIVGRFFDLQTLGAYNLFKNILFKIVAFINPVVNKISYSYMVKLGDKNKIKSMYFLSMKYIVIITCPIFLLISLNSQNLLDIFLPQYKNYYLILCFLSLYVGLRALSNPLGSLILALGKAKISFIWNLAMALIIPLFVYLGVFGGIYLVSLNLLMLFIFLKVVEYYLICKPLLDCNRFDNINYILKPLSINIFASILTIPFLFINNPIYSLISIVVCFLIVNGYIFFRVDKSIFKFFILFLGIKK